jgi:hypothetical protein
VPGDDEISVGVHRHGGVRLAEGRVGVDAELRARGRPGGGVPLGVDVRVVAGAHARAFPDDDEVPVGVHGDRGDVLGAGGVRVDAEFRAGGGAAERVALGVNAFAGPVLEVAHPHDDEVPVGVGGDGGEVLAVVGEGVDAELLPEGPAGVRRLHLHEAAEVRVVVTRAREDAGEGDSRGVVQHAGGAPLRLVGVAGKLLLADGGVVGKLAAVARPARRGGEGHQDPLLQGLSDARHGSTVRRRERSTAMHSRFLL